MNSDIIYFELNDWEPDEYYPNEEPFKTWMETLPFPLINDEWAKENKLCKSLSNCLKTVYAEYI